MITVKFKLEFEELLLSQAANAGKTGEVVRVFLAKEPLGGGQGLSTEMDVVANGALDLQVTATTDFFFTQGVEGIWTVEIQIPSDFTLDSNVRFETELSTDECIPPWVTG